MIYKIYAGTKINSCFFNSICQVIKIKFRISATIRNNNQIKFSSD